MTRRRRHHSSKMKCRGRGRAYKKQTWVRLWDGDWNLTASTRTVRRGGGRLPTPNELMGRIHLGNSKVTASFLSGGSGGSTRWSGILRKQRRVKVCSD